MATLLLALFILNLGTAFGAGLYEVKIVLPKWFPKSVAGEYSVNVVAMRELDSGRSFWAFVTTLPLTLLTLTSLIFALQSHQPGKDWWLAAALITLLERTSTFAFFIPTAIKFQRAEQLPSARIARLIPLWLRLNYIRNLLTPIACLVALRALALGV